MAEITEQRCTKLRQSGKIFVHGVVEHLKVDLVVLIDATELLPGQLRDESLPNSLARAQMSPVANPRQLSQVPEILRIQEY